MSKKTVAKKAKEEFAILLAAGFSAFAKSVDLSKKENITILDGNHRVTALRRLPKISLFR